MAGARTIVQDEVLDFLTSQPTLEAILAFQTGDEAQERVRYLLDTNRNGKLTAEEQFEMDEIGQLGHWVTMLKIRAREKMTEKVAEA